MEALKITLSILAIAIVAPFLWWSWSNNPGSDTDREMTQAEQDRSGARFACRQFISDRLHDPSSAQWGTRDDGWYARWPAESRGEGRVEVRAQFRANNAFGGTIISDWNCEVQATEDTWQLVNLSEN